ncbi:MAG: hypothetical protein ACYDHG_02090 [Desulfomonilaceae bacterium]
MAPPIAVNHQSNAFPSGIGMRYIPILQFQAFYEKIAKPFKWKYTKDDMKKTLERQQPTRFVSQPEAIKEDKVYATEIPK